ncbi:chromate transporter, partial [Candidatus Poribacteria bacterium]|nr:chromate transporter [Candidatus Poribacteria bacterium]
VITTGFIGYLVARFPGACVAAFATFFPCYLFTVIPAPILRKHGKLPAIVATANGVTAAATGAIAGAVIVLGRRSLVDLPTALIAVATYLVLWKTKKVPEPILIVLSAVLGLVLYPLIRG